MWQNLSQGVVSNLLNVLRTTRLINLDKSEIETIINLYNCYNINEFKYRIQLILECLYKFSIVDFAMKEYSKTRSSNNAFIRILASLQSSTFYLISEEIGPPLL